MEQNKRLTEELKKVSRDTYLRHQMEFAISLPEKEDDDKSYESRW